MAIVTTFNLRTLVTHIPDDPNIAIAKSQVLTFNTNNEHVEGIILYVPS